MSVGIDQRDRLAPRNAPAYHLGVPPFLVINQHAPEECESIGPGLENPPPHLNGTKFYCPCPFGEHGFYMVVEADSAEEIMQGLPSGWRKGTRAVGLEIFDL